MMSKTVLLLLTLAVLLVVTSSFQLSSKANPTFTNRRSTVSMNFFDNLKVIFSKEGQENIKAFNDREKEEALIAQKEILARRADPKKMREYEEKSDANRRKLAEERAVYKFQGVVKEGYDPLEDWQRLKNEGKIKMGKDLERDVKSSRLGSEGLLEVRVDERMPYIDQGYVDEDSDVMGKFMGMFNKKDKEKKEKE